MNKEIRDQVRKKIKESGLTQESFGEQVGLSQSYISNLLTGKTGILPETWGIVLDKLDLELYVRRKSKEDV